MSKTRSYTTKLLAKGLMVDKYHYGTFARNWWTFRQNNIILIRFDMRIGVELNTQLFTVWVVESFPTKLLPGYSCEVAGISSVQLTSSAAINEVYSNIFKTVIEYNVQAIMGFNDEQIVKKLLEDVEFYPFIINIQDISFFVAGLNLDITETGYISMFINKFRSQRCLFVQKIKKNHFL
jgi:hypothetical protein